MYLHVIMILNKIVAKSRIDWPFDMYNTMLVLINYSTVAIPSKIPTNVLSFQSVVKCNFVYLF